MNFNSEQPKIIVVGSCSIDLVLSTESIPNPDDTVIATNSASFFGGKGANQAVGTSRLGANVYFIGAIGMDPHGQQILRNLVDEGINVGYVHETERRNSGTAYVIDSEGRKTIVVVPDANYCLEPAHIDLAAKQFEDADLVLIQLEIPMDTVMRTVEIAKLHGVKIGVYAAPAKKLPQELIDNASFIVAKRSELKNVFGDTAAEDLLKMYPNKIFIRDDNNSTAYFNGSEMKYLLNDDESISFKMGMGDAFTSGFAFAFCHGNSVDSCVKFGNDVSLSAGQKQGSQTGLPTFREMKNYV